MEPTALLALPRLFRDREAIEKAPAQGRAQNTVAATMPIALAVDA
jgi:hypothetical protein